MVADGGRSSRASWAFSYHVRPVQRPRVDRDAEGAALARLGTHFDVAAQGLGQMLADAKAQSRAAELPRGRAIHLAERLEKFPDLFFVHADARVGHVEAQAQATAIGGESDGEADFALVGELDRVAHQIDQHLAQAQGVGEHGFGQGTGQFRLQLQLLRGGLRAHQGNDFGHHLDRRTTGRLDLELSGFDLREVEDVADHFQEVLAVAFDHGDVFSCSASDVLVQHEVGIAEDGGHGGADFVAHVGQKLALGAVGASAAWLA